MALLRGVYDKVLALSQQAQAPSKFADHADSVFAEG